VTLLAAKLVGPAGRVVGVDRAPAVLATAAERVAVRQLEQVTFVQDEVATLAVEQPFDAVVGRLVLMYQPDPAATLRHLAPLVVPGGVLAFLEMVILPGLPTPGRPLFHHVRQLVATAFAQSGAHVDMGLRLPAAFHNAGLPDPTVQVDLVTIIGADPTWLGSLAGVARTLVPAIERFGLATADELAIETLFDRLLTEAAAANTAVTGPAYVGGWVRRPHPST
jgi:SAM-dependent methyltransferase